MKSLLGLLVVALISLGGFASCGGNSGKAVSNTASQHSVKRDRDNDADNNDDDAHILEYGQAASPADRQVLTALITRYYAAAAALEGAKACSLLMPFIAESVTEDYGHTPALRGKSCAVVMSKLFRQHHQLLAGESATLKFLTVRVQGNKSLVVLSFSTLPEVRQISARRHGSGWKLLDLLDGILE
jgi:hypothetical protein